MSWVSRINRLSRYEKEGIYRTLIPPMLFHRYGVDPLTFRDAEERRLVRFYCPARDPSTLVELKADPDDCDCIYSIQISDAVDHTQFNWDFIVVNDPGAPRFDIDVDARGKDTLFGRADRNLEAEEAALAAGLYPGQIRRGLGLTDEIVNCLDQFSRILGFKSIHLEALFYHNAISYEKRGFTYFEGFRRMKRIDQAFQPGGVLFDRLDGSSPFRRKGFGETLFGRSWAIHDGILDGLDDELLDGWESPRMYRMVEKPRNVLTFSGGPADN
ncbi:hypothetical protein ACFL4G_04585 [Thermodesulfobacteriota bacterium]